MSHTFPRAFVLLCGLPIAACSHDADQAGLDGPLLVDAALEACVRDALQLADGEVFAEDVAELQRLNCADRGIADISGLEAFTSLDELSLWENDIRDLEPLSGLTQLRTLQLGANPIADLAPLAGLVGLERLGLGSADLHDVQALADLGALTWLDLNDNALTSDAVSPLCELGALSWLMVDHNRIDDVSALDCVPGEVYESYQSSAEARVQPGPDPLAELGPMGPGLEGATLRVTPVMHGGLALELVSDTVHSTVIVEGGELRAEGEQVFFDAVERSLEVGTLRDGGLSLCEGELGLACRARWGVKADGTAHPELAAPAPVVTLRLAPAGWDSSWELLPVDGEELRANTELVDLTLASPNQYDAGSCLFMANTGAMEILLNQHTALDAIDYLGDTDLSERYLMNASDYTTRAQMSYSITDVTYTYDAFGGSLLSRDYPFIADYLRETSSGGLVEADPDDEGAFFTCYANWLDGLPDDWQETLTVTPDVERSVIFLDPDLDSSSIWNVGIMDWETIERIKHELDTKKAPVVLVYNHYLYWHANIIVGYDDSIDSDGCPMVESTLSYFQQQGYNSYVSRINSRIDELGGCSDQGVFYVRDSIYSGGITEQDYTYSEEYGFSDKYSKRITQLSYNWAVYLGNHAYSVHRGR